jgi:hypothetical protein
MRKKVLPIEPFLLLKNRGNWVKILYMDFIYSNCKRKLQKRAGLSREALDRSLEALPEQHRGDALKLLLRTSDHVLQAVLREFSMLAESFTCSVGETFVHHPDTDIGGVPSPGSYTETLPGDQRDRVLAEGQGWIRDEDVSYVIRRDFDWTGMKSFIEGLTDKDALQVIAARIECDR